MNKLVMRRKASDNVYFHPQFHIAMNMIIDYIEKNFGKKAVREYLKQFAAACYKPLKEKIKKQGLKALAGYIEQLYRKEGAKVKIYRETDLLKVSIKKCPAVSYIRKKKQPVSRSFFETTKTIYETILESTDFEFKVDKYDRKTGGSVLIFRRKE
ncbi:MAG: hypothetical protein NC937_01250 [Candidatus Omnitrophica bacterium]|nr:hypothetical protein [Candidatus Omnitrophota bacterium]MCM8824769.1 hypothetical protein [Candidatus Omnitrophota bacterium]MCM8828917.1 hypothetical protein [Candidatus Omnitrophota bacterium]